MIILYLSYFMSILNYLSNLYNIPDDINNKIENYIIFPQNKNLLDDIKNLKIMKDKIYNEYNEQGYIQNNDMLDEYNINSQFDTDLLYYFNDLKLYSEIITENNIDKVERLFVYNLKKEKYGEKRTLDNFHINFKIPILSRINRYLACLTIDERDDFFEYIKIPELEIIN